MTRFRQIIIIFLLFLAGLGFRLYGLNWDLGQHLHPDERFLTMVASEIKLPDSLASYLNTATSPLNPYNYPQFQFFVYGTLPLFITKLTAVVFKLDNYGYLHLTGRFLSSVFDAGNIILLILLSRLIMPSRSRAVYLAGAIYAVTVLPVQLSHFFAVDTFLTFFLLLCFTALAYFVHCRRPGFLIIAALGLGAAVASKITAALFAPVALLFFIAFWLSSANKKIAFFQTFFWGLLFAVIALVVFRLAQPYAFISPFKVNPQFIANLVTLSKQSRPIIYFPPAIQWISKTPLLFPFQNLVMWGLGLPMSLLIGFLFVIFIIRSVRSRPWSGRRQGILVICLSFIWVIGLFVYQGLQFAHSMRYFLPVYPFLALIAAYFIHRLKPSSVLAGVLLGLHLLWLIMFLNIYSQPHSRIQASRWIYQNIPAGSSLSADYWDDALPLPLPGSNYQSYNYITLTPFDPDTPEKWQKLNNSLAQIDYLVLSSNRAWASIPQVPHLYPQTSQYYQDLFAQKLGFTQVRRFTSYPGFRIPFLDRCIYFGPGNYPLSSLNRWLTVDSACSSPGLYLRDDTAEEAFTVYDHPQVIIFKR